jgi:DNA polymerase IV
MGPPDTADAADPAGTATILHADLDAFYASVEQLLDPSLRGRPIAVGGGVVLAASYEARAFGVRAGMAGWRARQLCPDLRLVGGHFEHYQRLGDEAIGVLRDFTPQVERISIDEAFADVAGSTHLFGAPSDIARRVRCRVRREIGLPVSVGVARTKHLAKIASQVAKPDGLVVVEPQDEREFLRPLPVELMWGVGAVTRQRLADLGIHRIGDLAATSPDLLEHLLGQAAGARLGLLSRNVDPRRIEHTRTAASMGAQAALGERTATSALVRATLGFLADRVAGRLRASRRAGRTVTVRVRFADLHSVTRSVTVPVGLSATLPLAELATTLAHAALDDHPDQPQISLLGLSIGHLVDESSLQLELPLYLEDDRCRPGTASGAARRSVDRAVDAIRARFGREAVDYALVRFSDVDRVPDAFRELAQRDRPSGAESSPMNGAKTDPQTGARARRRQ